MRPSRGIKTAAWERLVLLAKRRDGWVCRKCDSKPGPDNRLEVHHIQPVADGGPDFLENLVTLCRRCHIETHSHLRVSDVKADWNQLVKELVP